MRESEPLNTLHLLADRERLKLHDPDAMTWDRLKTIAASGSSGQSRRAQQGVKRGTNRGLALSTGRPLPEVLK